LQFIFHTQTKDKKLIELKLPYISGPVCDPAQLFWTKINIICQISSVPMECLVNSKKWANSLQLHWLCPNLCPNLCTGKQSWMNQADQGKGTSLD